LAVSHAVPAGSREVTVAFNFISERTVYHTVQCLESAHSVNRF
jgi:hypothetical protein